MDDIKYIKKFTSRMKHKGIMSFPVFSDGSCLFHALAFNLNVSKVRSLMQKQQRRNVGLNIRKQIIDPKQWKRFGKVTGFTSIQPSISKAKHESFYAGDFILNFTARRLGVNILVSDNSSDKSYLFPCQKSGRPYVCLKWIARCHFEPLVEVNPEGTFSLQNQNKRFPKANSRYIRGLLPKDSRLVKKLLTRL